MIFAVCSFVSIILTLYMVQKNIEVVSKRRSTVVVRPQTRPSAAGYMQLMSGKAREKRRNDIAAGIVPVAAQKRDIQSICKEEEEQILLKSLTNSQEAINNHDSHAAIDSILGLIEVDDEEGPAKDDIDLNLFDDDDEEEKGPAKDDIDLNLFDDHEEEEKDPAKDDIDLNLFDDHEEEEKDPAKDDIDLNLFNDDNEEDWSVPDLEMEDLAKQMKEFSGQHH